MSSASPRVPVIALLLVTVLATAGCSRVSSPRDWTSTAELAAGGSHTIDVRDTSGRVDNVEIDPAGVDVFGAVANPPGQPSVLIVPWTGGACDEVTDIAIAANGQGLTLSVSTQVSKRVCDAIGVGHALRITLSQPIPAAAVTVTTKP